MKDRLIEVLTASMDKQHEKRNLITPQHTADDLLANGVIAPPCKVGDRVYALFNGKVIKASIFSMKIETEDNKFVFMPKLKIYDHFFQFKTFLLGKSVFLTKEEAEQALKEREG